MCAALERYLLLRTFPFVFLSVDFLLHTPPVFQVGVAYLLLTAEEAPPCLLFCRLIAVLVVALFLSYSIRCGFLVASWPYFAVYFAAYIRTSCWFDCSGSGAFRFSLDLGSAVNNPAKCSLGGLDIPNYLRHGGMDHGGSEDSFACSLDYVNSLECYFAFGSCLDADGQLLLVRSFQCFPDLDALFS